ncbi:MULTISPECIES: hypothetical protein [unclassified Microbacterium]|uniref:hypothetical protein n=1 Tax=Microbacterium TaxID=33882 RepID=UPI003BA1C849
MTDLRDIVAAASSAPSAHNTQPWDARIRSDAIELGVAEGRTLRVGDPTGRDTVLALGAWTEAAAAAARARGRALDVQILPALADPAVIVRAERRDPVARLALGGEVPVQRTALDRRLTYRGAVRRVPGFLEAASAVVPPWIRLVPIAAGDLRRLSALGTADTLTRPGVAEELASWLRLSPQHPRYDLDGLSDRVLLLPPHLAALAAPFTRRRRLRDGAARVARIGGDLVRRVLLEVPVQAAGEAADADHFVLVVESDELDLGTGAALTRILNSPLGLPAETVFEVGRALMRVWLLAAERGIAFAPHSEVLDSALAQGELQYRLGLGRRAVPLFVTSAGRPMAVPPRSPRLG